MKLLIQDNFFENVDEIRKVALSMEYVKSEGLTNVGWRGERTQRLEKYNDSLLNDCTRKVLNTVSEFYGISDHLICTYFHISYENTRNEFFEFDLRKYHQDGKKYAGVVYLTPNPVSPKETGTSILDGAKNKIINVENVYNRLVAYSGSNVHAPSNVFGDTKENGRMTFTFFIDDQEEHYDEWGKIYENQFTCGPQV